MTRRCVVRTVNTEFKSRVKRSPIQAGFHLRRSQCRSRNQKRRTLRSSENSVLIALTTPSFTIKWKLGRRSRKQKRNNYETNHTKRRNVHWDWFILPPLLPTPTIWFSLDCKRRSHQRNQKKMETFWFFWLRFRRAYDPCLDCLRLRFLIFTRSYISVLTTPLMILSPTPLLMKTSLKRLKTIDH